MKEKSGEANETEPMLSQNAVAVSYADSGKKKFSALNAEKWATNLYSVPNLIVCSHYFNIGFALMFLATPVAYYLVVTLDADSATVNTYSAISYLPWCLKIFMGVLSDCVPINGKHREPYLLGGWAIFVGSNVVLWAQSTPGIPSVLLWTFIMTMGCLQADTAADAMIVECSVYETEENKGRLRTQGYLVRQFGCIFGGVCGSFLYNSVADGGSWGWGLSIGQCFMLQAALPTITLLTLIPYMTELPLRGEVQQVRVIFNQCWDFVKVDAVWIPLMFLYIYELCYITNPAWSNFLYLGLGFSDFQVGMLYTVGTVLGAVGLWAYDRYFFKSKWPFLYIWTTLVNGAFSFAQLALCYQMTWIIPKFWFATGDYAIANAVQYICFMPMCIMFLPMIPEGTEGTMYALISTWQNVASEVAYDIGTLLECIWPVTNVELENGHWNTLITLTWITSFCQCLPVCLVYCSFKGVRMLPDDIVMTKAQCNMENTSYWGAFAFNTILLGSIFISCAQAIWVIFDPDAC